MFNADIDVVNFADVRFFEVAFIIDTDSYSGNFERELATFITGYDFDDYCSYKSYAERFREDIDDPEYENQLAPELVQEMKEKAGTCRNNEYGDVHCAIAATPGRVNNGMGRHTDATPENLKNIKSHCTAYESVAIFFNERPSDELIEWMKLRAQDFHYIGAPAQPKILGFRLAEQTRVVHEDCESA